MRGGKDMAGNRQRPETAGGTAMVRVDALRNFPAIAIRLGGDPDALLAKASIDPVVLTSRHAVIAYQSLARLLHLASAELSCPDFGMRLAAGQQGIKAFGPLEVAMRNCETLRSAFACCAAHMRVYSPCAQLTVEGDGETAFLRLQLDLPEPILQPQAVEHMLLLLHHGLADLSAGDAGSSAVWFAHQPVAPVPAYEEHFGAKVCFGQVANGLRVPERLLDSAISGADPQLYELASYFIKVHFPPDESGLGTRVAALIEPLLPQGRCTQDEVADMLGLGARALQRRLKAENTSFEAIRENVRRDLAARYLRQMDIPLIRVARLLGYSDASVLTRSCYRWFSASPRQLRKG